MTEPGALSDAELMTRAHRWRHESMHGTVDARNHAHAHEAEVRRRFTGVTTIQGPLDTTPRKPKRSIWRFWSR